MSDDLETAIREQAQATVLAIGAAGMTTQYVCVALLVAAAERGAIDTQRVFSLLDVVATGLENAADAPPGGPMAAILLRSIEPAFRSMTTIPAGAGRA